MAAIYSGIHLKLKSAQTPWEDKLKLARFAWISSQCLIPNKEQVLLDWCTHALAVCHGKKAEFSQDVLEGLWRYLDDVLHSQKLQSFLKQGKMLMLRLNVAQLLLDRLTECSHGSPRLSELTILSVCHGILSTSVLSSVFTTKYELMVNLVSKLILLGCHKIQKRLLSNSEKEDMRHPQSPKVTSPSTSLFEVLLQALSCYLSVQRQQANPNRVLTVVTNQLLQPLLLLRYLLTSQEFTSSHLELALRQPLRRDIRLKADSILQAALFPMEHLTAYKADLCPSKADSVKSIPGGSKGPLKPFSVVLSKLSAGGQCEASLDYGVKCEALPLLFKFFLESYGKGKAETQEEHKMLCFYFLSGVTSALDLSSDGHSVTPSEQQGAVSAQSQCSEASACGPKSWNLALKALESLLNQALTADIYNVAADRLRYGEVQLKWYRSLVQVLLEAKPCIPAWYRCMKILLSLNHLILEPDLEQLISTAWVNANSTETQMLRARQLLVCGLLHTYTKLRQLPRLFSELLSVICQPAPDGSGAPLLSEGMGSSLAACLLETPPTQILEICSSVLTGIKMSVIPTLGRKNTGEEEMEIDGGQDDPEQEKAAATLFSLSLLLHAVLFGMKTLENSSSTPLIQRGHRLMEEMQKLIKELLGLLSAGKVSLKMDISSSQKVSKKGKKNQKKAESVSEPNGNPRCEQKTQEAVLLLFYTFVEVDTLFHIYCSRYTAVPLPVETEASGTAALLSHIETLISGSLLHTASCLSALLLKLLTLQQVKKVLLEDASLSEPGAGSLLNRAVEFILAESQFDEGVVGELVWDGQIGNVSANSYRVAHWYLVASNFPVLAPYMSGAEAERVADALVRSLLARTEGSDSPTPGSLTFPLVSSQLLESPAFPEVRSLFSATVRTITQRFTNVLKRGTSAKARPAFLKSYEKQPLGVLSWSIEEMTETLVEDVSASIKSGDVIILLTEEQTVELQRLLEILSSLNPDGMSTQDLPFVFFLLLFVFTCTSQQQDQGKEDSLLPLRLLRTLSCLVEGKCFPRVLKLIHGSTLLQTVISCFLRQSFIAQLLSLSPTCWLDLVKAVQSVIQSLVHLIITRNSSVILNLDQFTTYLTCKERECREAAQSSPEASALPVHALLATLTSFSNAMISNLGRNKPMDQTLTQMLGRVSSSLAPSVEFVLQHRAPCHTADHTSSVLHQAFIVEVVSVMLRCELAALSSEDKSTQSGSPFVLAHMPLFKAFCQQIFKEMSSAARPIDFLASSLRYLSAFYSALEKTSRRREDKEVTDEDESELDKVYTQILENVHKLQTAPWLSADDVMELEPALQELLNHLVERSSSRQFNRLLLMIRGGLDVGELRAGNHREVLFAVITVKLLSCCQLPESCSRALWLIAPQILSALVFLVRSSSEDVSLALSLTVPTVTSMTSLLRRGEGLIPNPHHVILTLGALLSLPLHPLSPPAYHAVFLAAHEALFAIIRCHPEVIPTAAPSFLNVFYRLVASVMQEGRQRGDPDTGGQMDVYVDCSRLIERMCSHIAAVADSFKALAAFMVAQYVTELQKVTLRTDVKLHLTEGIYYILDLCKEQDIKFLKAGLHPGVQEVFNELYSSYTHYHKTQRQGEDKYTV